MSSSVDPALLEQIKTILRRDLKLGPSAEIADDMPLMGGQTDFDSLDILLLVSSLEKTFGLKIPNEAVGRKLFGDVMTLARYVQEHRSGASVSPVSQTGATAVEPDWLSLLPHGPEFRYVTKVNEVKPGERASAAWSVRGDEVFFKAHFPNHPLVPGVLIAEALAQVAGLAVSDGKAHRRGMLVHIDIRFDAPVQPPATIELSAELSRAMEHLRLCNVTATVNGKTIARGALTLQID